MTEISLAVLGGKGKAADMLAFRGELQENRREKKNKNLKKPCRSFLNFSGNAQKKHFREMEASRNDEVQFWI